MFGLDDFYAFKSTGGGGGGDSGCFGCLAALLLAVAVLWLIGKLFG